MFTNDRHPYRQAFFTAWQKHLHHETLQPQEKEIVSVILEHPEYQSLLCNDPKKTDYDLEENPFLHMGLHLAVREQIQIDSPKGIQAIYRKLIEQSLDAHHAEHKMMTCLGQMIWQAQQKGEMPDQEDYLSMIYNLL